MSDMRDAPVVLTVGSFRFALMRHDRVVLENALVVLRQDQVLHLRNGNLSPEDERFTDLRIRAVARMLHVLRHGTAPKEAEGSKQWRTARLAEIDGVPGVAYPRSRRRAPAPTAGTEQQPLDVNVEYLREADRRRAAEQNTEPTEASHAAVSGEES